MGDYAIYIDALVEGDWFQNLSDQLQDAELETFQSEGTPDIVKDLTSYDRPDIILLDEQDPVLILEKTGHVPTGKNPLQRVARMVKAAEMGVPGVFFTPYEVMKHGENPSKCNANYRLIESLRQIGEIHDTDVLIPPWPSDNELELVQDGSEDELLAEFIDQFLSNGCDTDVPAADTIREETNKEVKRILDEYAGYKQPPPSVDISPTNKYRDELTEKSTKEQTTGLLPQRDETVISLCNMSPENSGRVDPYGGAQFAYDYLYCRTGPSTSDRRRNLALKIPKVPKEVWLEKNPYKPENKSSLWYKCADVIELKDAVLTDFEQYRHEKPDI